MFLPHFYIAILNLIYTDDSEVDQEDTDDISSTANLKIVPNSKSTQNTVQNINTYHRFTIRNSKFKYNGKGKIIFKGTKTLADIRRM